MLALALLLSLSLGREVPLSTPVIEPAPFGRQAPQVASNGTDYLVVWTEGEYGGAVHAARVDRNGAVLDPQSLFLGRHSGGSAAVASDGHDYVVAFNCGLAVPSQTCLAHVAAATGNVTRGATFAGANPAIASNGSGYLVVTQQGSSLSGKPITGLAIRPDGSIGGEPFAIGETAFPIGIASNGRDYLVVWSTYSFLDAVLVSDRAVIGERQRFTTFKPAWGPGPFDWSVASDGDGFLVAWQQNRRAAGTSYVTDLRVSSVTSDGRAGEPRTVLAEETFEPAVAWTGSQYLLTWTHSEPSSAPYLWGDAPGDVRGLTVDAAGNASTPMTVAARPTRETASASASNGASTLIVWENEHRGDAAQIEARFLGSDETFIVSTRLTWQESVAAMRRGGNAVFAWSENTGEAQIRKVFVQRVDAWRRPRDGRGLAVAASPRHQLRPALAGSLVAWVEEDPVRTRESVARVRVQMLDATGAPVGEAIEVGDAAHGSKVSIAAAGSTHLVAWESPEHRIAGAHFDPVARAGEAPRPFEISSGPLDHTPAVASDGTRFLVVWQRDRYEGIICVMGCTPPRSIHAATVASWGVVGGSPVLIADRDQMTAPPMPVWNGSEYAVFWSIWTDGVPRVRRVNRVGLPVGAEETIATNGVPLAVAWTGSEYLLATSWTEPLSVVRVDREFGVVQTLPVPADVVIDSGAAVIDGWVAYSAGPGSRVAARPLGDDPAPSRRRSAR